MPASLASNFSLSHIKRDIENQYVKKERPKREREKSNLLLVLRIGKRTKKKEAAYKLFIIEFLFLCDSHFEQRARWMDGGERERKKIFFSSKYNNIASFLIKNVINTTQKTKLTSSQKNLGLSFLSLSFTRALSLSCSSSLSSTVVI